jgi:putative membrane protein
MGRLLTRWILSSVAIAVVAWLLPGIRVGGTGLPAVLTVLVTAAVLGLVNAIVKPLLKLLTCPLIVLTLGLFLFLINAAMLMLASVLTRALAFPFVVDGWGSALVGSILITIVTWLLSLFIPDPGDD